MIYGRPTPTPHPGRPHKYALLIQKDGVAASYCFCGHRLDEAKVRQGKNNRDRGLAIQRKVLARMGLTHLPGNGPVDGRSRGENAAYVAEVKSGARFNKADWADIHKLPADASQLRLLVKVETPGPGRRARGTVTCDLEDWIAWYRGDAA